jgi:hypothetical protein
MSFPGLFDSRLVIPSLVLILEALAPPLHAQNCTVPGSYVTIQEAIDDPACVTITLSAQTYGESIVIPRSLPLAGPRAGGAIVQGLVLVVGSGTEVGLQDLRVENGCVPDALRTASGARMTGENLEVVRSAALPCPATADSIFADGFESGDTTNWSGSIP